MVKQILLKQIKHLPRGPGVYFFYNKKGQLVYIGKAKNIFKRVSSHFRNRNLKNSTRINADNNADKRGLNKQDIGVNQRRIPARLGRERESASLSETPLKEKMTAEIRKINPHTFPQSIKPREIMKYEGVGVKFKKTETEIDALILESQLIKKYRPKYNILLRDDKNFFFVGITKEEFPRIFITHRPLEINLKYNLQVPMFLLHKKSGSRFGKADIGTTAYIGPFTDGKSLKLILRLLRKIFPYRHCRVMPKTTCLQYHLNRCGGLCELHSHVGRATPARQFRGGSDTKKQYAKDIKNLTDILTGKKQSVLKKWEKEMKKEAEKENFEKAAKIRDNMSALQKIFAHSPVLEKENVNYRIIEKELKKTLKTKKDIKRIEAYDISNIQGENAVGSMIVFENGKVKKSDYRRFKIRMKNEPNDPAMINEVLTRRLRHPEWPTADLIIIDGGITQLNAAKNVLTALKPVSPSNILLCSIAKNPDRLFIDNKKIPLKNLSENLKLLLRQIRDEAHRFAVSYHRKVRRRKMLEI